MGKGQKKLSVFGGDFPRTKKLSDFIWSAEDEPHRSRREAIRKAHPEVKNLFGYEPKTKWIVLALVALQLSCGYLLRDMAWTWQFWLTAYVVGATTTQALFLAIHEITHGLAFEKFWVNRVFNMLPNIPIVIPYAATFKGYHLEHHKMQGLQGVDTDLPTALEGKLFNSFLGKLFFCIFQIFFYALRPGIVRAQTLTKWHALNWGFQLTSNYLVYKAFGWGPIFYFLASAFLAGSLHPCASHFIAEHYVFVEEWETYSYYGPLNALCFNVGYHNEHHDFPNIAWTKLPLLRKMAPEFYENLPQHKSWPLVLWKFIFDSNVGMYNRVKRQPKTKST
eukprot:CAMPEP_0205832774 /NCGR_PEP_ID=MMETSP0206-20130828/47855_1 /ASSEMBLY_ACC=CAM_ASM_000279 /TAXON_ID=36767 /ORGANISM="Euplotes focardii, Strain TN1" /LENGTH=334 /DNA_ID=CAMNT_0053138599 /DNA_START=25 /DNA_END=1029 /DNA_ORIENTATION=+